MVFGYWISWVAGREVGGQEKSDSGFGVAGEGNDGWDAGRGVDSGLDYSPSQARESKLTEVRDKPRMAGKCVKMYHRA